MNHAWRQALIFCVGSLILLFASIRLQGAAKHQSSLPRGLEAARKTLEKSGGEEGIDRRLNSLKEIEENLQGNLRARSGDATRFHQRVEEVFSELGLILDAASDWQALADHPLPEAVAFERTFSGRGSFEAVVSAVATFESWPDQAKIRHLKLEPNPEEGASPIRFTLVISTVRMLPESEGASPSEGTSPKEGEK